MTAILPQQSSMFLSRAEVAELTGAKLKRRQISVLVRNGTRHTINAAGWPMVARAVIEGGAQSTAAPQAWKPNKAA